MTSVPRPPRGGRPNKVVKASAPQRPGGGGSRLVGRQQHLDLGAAGVIGGDQNLGKVQIDPQITNYPDSTSLIDPHFAAQEALSATAHLQQHHQQLDLSGGTEDGEGDEEVDADMDDDGAVSAAMAQHAEQMDLTAANILANGSAVVPDQSGLAHHAHHHQPPAPMGQQMSGTPSHAMDPQLQVKTTEELAHQSGYTGITVESALAKRLAKEPGQRLAHQRRPDQQLNLGRRSNVEALFAHVAGELAPQPCKNCHKGHGPWNSCIVVDGQMCGSCANCWFNASGARCSFHETRNPANMHHHQQQVMPQAGSLQYADPVGQYVTHAALIPQAPPSVQNAAISALGLSMPVSPAVQQTVTSAYDAVRKADKKARQLMLIEIAAKQLMLQVVEYETSFPEETPSVAPGQQGMGDDGGS